MVRVPIKSVSILEDRAFFSNTEEIGQRQRRSRPSGALTPGLIHRQRPPLSGGASQSGNLLTQLVFM